MSIHLGALSLISGGPSECLTLEVKLEFGGSLDLEINIFGLVHKTKTKQTSFPSWSGSGLQLSSGGGEKGHPRPPQVPTEGPLLATKTLSWQQGQLRKCCFSHNLRKLSKDAFMSLAPPSLGKQEAPESTGPDHVLGRGYLLSPDGLELNSRYPTTTSRVCLCPCCYS